MIAVITFNLIVVVIIMITIEPLLCDLLLGSGIKLRLIKIYLVVLCIARGLDLPPGLKWSCQKYLALAALLNILHKAATGHKPRNNNRMVNEWLLQALVKYPHKNSLWLPWCHELERWQKRIIDPLS